MLRSACRVVKIPIIASVREVHNNGFVTVYHITKEVAVCHKAFNCLRRFLIDEDRQLKKGKEFIITVLVHKTSGAFHLL